MNDSVELCRLCEARPHDTLCDQCSACVCFACCAGTEGEVICDECFLAEADGGGVA